MRFDVPPLPQEALAAAAEFHARVPGEVEAVLHSLKPLPFGGADGGRGSPASAELTDKSHPNPSPEGEGLTLVFADAPREHRGWRLAAVQGLARTFAPVRINALEGGDIAAQREACQWLDSAQAVTGQLIALA